MLSSTVTSPQPVCPTPYSATTTQQQQQQQPSSRGLLLLRRACPFFSNNKDLHRVEDDTQAFLKQFVFAGSENPVHRLQDLVMDYRDIFSDVLAKRAVDLTPFRFNVEEPLWETPGNRTPCRPQSVKNNIEIEKAITTMLADAWLKNNTYRTTVTQWLYRRQKIRCESALTTGT